MSVHNHKVAGKCSSSENITSIGFKAFRIAENLCGAGGRHGCQQETIADTVFHYVGSKRIPIEFCSITQLAHGIYPPQVKLKLPLR